MQGTATKSTAIQTHLLSASLEHFPVVGTTRALRRRGAAGGRGRGRRVHFAAKLPALVRGGERRPRRWGGVSLSSRRPRTPAWAEATARPVSPPRRSARLWGGAVARKQAQRAGFFWLLGGDFGCCWEGRLKKKF